MGTGIRGRIGAEAEEGRGVRRGSQELGGQRSKRGGGTEATRAWRVAWELKCTRGGGGLGALGVEAAESERRRRD